MILFKFLSSFSSRTLECAASLLIMSSLLCAALDGR